ncbi:YHYH domain-containing protein [Helcococcus kunzii]
MKNKNKIIILSLAILVTFSGMSSAHPGRTDKNGGHRCRTNCTERWGLFYGEYHHHASDGSYTNSKGERFDKRGNKILSTNDQIPKEESIEESIKDVEKSDLELESYKEEAKITKENLEESEDKIESLKNRT